MGAFIVAFGMILMIVIHEGGHFIAAKAFGMKATEAFFGFGPKLWSTTRGETEYGVKAIPLGGYVRIIGMNMLEEVDPADEGRTYREKPFWQKSIVVLAGIGSHFVVAFLLLYAINVFWGVGTGEASLTIATVSAEFQGQETPASVMGLEPGDTVLAVNGTPVATWDDFVAEVRELPGQEATLTIDRSGTELDLTAALITREVDGELTGYVGVSPSELVEKSNAVVGVARAAGDVGSLTVANVIGLKELVVNVPQILTSTVNNDSEGLEEVRPVSVIGLTRIGGQADTVTVLFLLAFVNIVVGVLNVVPLYPLDGGHFAVALYEKIRGRAPDVRKLVPVAVLVFAFVVGLGLLGVYLDIVNPLELPQ